MNLNNKSLIIGGLVVVAVLIAAYVVMANPKKATAPEQAVIDETAWVEVKSESLFVYINGEKRVLKNGDTVKSGDTLETNATGTGTIHFPDGSVARLDSGTKLTLSAISFNPETKSLVVKMGLAIGRVWSKVVGLATPQSSWEVKTSNTVATVRGTAFGVIYKSNTSWVLGSENTVAVVPVDPRTGKENQKSEVPIGENRQIMITNADAAAASTAVDSSALSKRVTGISKEFSDDPWVRGNKNADKEFDGTRAKPSATVETSTQAEVNVNTPTPPSVTTPAPSRTVPTKANTTISAGRSLIDIAENDAVQFKATAGTGSQATDVTNELKWNVTGSIGTISPSGLFTATLGADVSEFGEGTGSVTATLPNGEVIQGPSIRVKAKVPTDLGTEG